MAFKKSAFLLMAATLMAGVSTTALAQALSSPDQAAPSSVMRARPAIYDALQNPGYAAPPEKSAETPVVAQPIAAAPAPHMADIAAPVSQDVISLVTALAEAYQHNPELAAARAELRGVDESYAIAMSGYRPVIAGDASYISSHDSGDVTDSSSDPKTVGVGVTQPLYRGGSTTANVDTADHRVRAQRALLLGVEQDVLFSAVSAYMNVIRDRRVVELNHSNKTVFNKYLEEARQRFELGDITKTDVSQAESRLANATAGLVSAEGDYRSSRAAFERIIGLTPDGLEIPASIPALPATLEEAMALAEQNNPDILFARDAAEAARASTRSIMGEKMPQVDLTASAGHTIDPGTRVDDHVTSTAIGVVATIPLYTAGATDARVRQSRQIEQQRRKDIANAERIVRQSVVDAWAGLVAANAELEARATQIDAAQLALEGVKVENAYGSRTTLDLLDAEQEYLDAQVAVVTAESERTVAAYALLSAMGQLTAAGLDLPGERYDTATYFQKSKNRWFGTSVGETAAE
jgi:outer membrane protein/adhesin transport system outer membrane protein